MDTNSTISQVRLLTEDLAFFTLAVDEPLDFVPGQYVTVSAEVDGLLVRRPYSVGRANERPASSFEILVRRARGGLLTGWLWSQRPGCRLHVSPARGRLTVDQLPGDQFVMVATGSAVAPFAAITTLAESGRIRNAVLIHGVAHADELAYCELFADAAARHGMRYIPIVSRPLDGRSQGWIGRIGRVQSSVEEVLGGVAEANIAVLICGNPEMTKDVRATVLEYGIPPDRVRTETYWPDSGNRPGRIQPAE